MTFNCGAGGAPDDALRVLSTLIACCQGAAVNGPQGCTCWEPEYDLEQADPHSDTEPTIRGRMCGDCAFLPTSPERTGDERYVADEDVMAARKPFWCHQGIRKPVRYRHPAGITVEATGDFYEPPLTVVNGEAIPFKADGTPADRCAGWAARRSEDSGVIADTLAEIPS